MVFIAPQKTTLISIPSFHLSFSPNSAIHSNSIRWTMMPHFSAMWLHLQCQHFILGHGFGKSLQWFSARSCLSIGIWYAYQAKMIPHNFMLHYENNVGYNLIWINSTQTIFKLFWHFFFVEVKSEGGGGTNEHTNRPLRFCVCVFAGIQIENEPKEKCQEKKTTKTYHMQSINTEME